MTEKSADHVCDENTFNHVFRMYSTALFKFLYYKFGPDNNPDDLVQEAFLKLWKNCRDVPPEKAKSFLFTVANNQMLNNIDKQKTALKYRDSSEIRIADYESPEYVMEEKQYSTRLQEAINSLSEEQRVTFMLNRIEEKSHKEIAEMLGISRKAVEKRIYTALKKIREFIESHE